MMASSVQLKMVRAARAGDVAGVKAALEHGGQVDGGGGAGRQALHEACEAGRSEVVRLLLSHKAQVNIRSKRHGDEGGTALHLVAEAGHLDIMEELLNAGADPEIRDEKGRTPMHWAAYGGQQGALQVLEGRNSDLLLAIDNDHSTALHLAAAHGDLGTVKWLVGRGLDPGARDYRNKTPKEIAKERKWQDVHLYLKQQQSPSKRSRPQSPWRGSMGYLSTRSKTSHASEDDLLSIKEAPAATVVSVHQEPPARAQSPPPKDTSITSITTTASIASSSSSYRLKAAGHSAGTLDDMSVHHLDQEPRGALTTQAREQDRDKGKTDDMERERQADRDTITSLRTQLEALQGEVARFKGKEAVTQEEMLRKETEREAAKVAEAEMKVKVAQLTRRLEEKQREEGERSRGEGAAPPGSPGAQAKIKELQRKNEYNQKMIEDMNDEIDDLYRQLKVLEVTSATTQTKLRGKESLLEEVEEEARQTEAKLREEVARLSRRLEEERQKVTEAKQDTRSLQQLQGEDAALRRTIGSLQEQLRQQESDSRQQSAALRKQLLEEEASHRQAVEALRKQLKTEEDSNRAVIASLRQQLQDSTEVQEQDSHLRQYIASLRQQLQEEETANRKNVSALRQQLQEQEASKRETVAAMRQQLQDQEDSSKRSIASLKQQLQDEEEINRQTIGSLRQQVQEASSQQEQGSYNRQQITALRQQLLEEGAAHKKTISTLRQQLQDREDSHVQAVTSLKQQLQEATNRLQQDTLNRQQIASLKQQLEEQEEASRKTIAVLKQQMQREEESNRQTVAELRQELSRLSLQHTEGEHKSLSLQRDHEDLLREAEQQQERSRRTIEELSASVTTLTGRLREQEETLTSCKEELRDKERLLEERQEEARLKEGALREEVERAARRLEEERQKVLAAQSREHETSRKLHEHVGELERIIDSLNDDVAEKNSKLGEYEQMVASYQVQLRHKERQLEQREAAGQQSVATLQQKVDALAQMLEEEQQKVAQAQEKLQEAEESHKQAVALLRQQLQEAVDEAEEEKHRNLALQKQQQKRIQELLVQDQHNKNTLNERNNKIKEFEQTFSSYEMQLQSARKQIEQHDTNKHQTIGALSAEVVRFSQKVEEEKKKAVVAQNRAAQLLEQDKVNKLNITDLSNKLRDYEKTIATIQLDKEQLQQELARSYRSNEAFQAASAQHDDLKEARAQLEAEQRERMREQEASRNRIAALEDALAGSHRQSSAPSRSRSRSRAETPSRVTLMPSGIPNLGNTCYINSVVQCLFSITILREYFTSDSYRRDLYRGSELQGQVAAAVAGVFRGLEEGRGERDVRTKIKHLKEVAGVCSEEFRGSQQRNAHDFLSSLLNWLHEDLTRPSGSSVVTKNFAGSVRDVVRCDRSGEEVKRSSRTFTTLSVPVPRGKGFSLQEVLESHFRPHNEEWECPHCRRAHVCRQNTRLTHLPPLLIIHLSRAAAGSRESQSKKAKVSFPMENLNLQDYMDHRDRSPSYELFGIVSHQGTMNAGHYTALCRSPPNSTWYLYDDEKVSEVPARRVQTEADVHVLFYSLLKT